MDDAFVQEQIDDTKAMITAYNAAITFLIANPTKSYRLDTGQSVQDVRRQDLETMQAQLDTLMNRCAALGARLNGAATIVQPAW